METDSLSGKDREHLKLLSIFHYVFSGMTALFANFPIIHLVIGLFMIIKPEAFEGEGDPPPAIIGYLFAGFAAAFIIAGWVMAILIFMAGRSLARGKRYTLCLAVAVLECLMMPFGTVLGVFTLLVLLRESVKQFFACNRTNGTVPSTFPAIPFE